MTTNKDFKRVVRARMAKTGESYTTARATIVKKPPPLAAVSAATSTPEPAELARLAGMSNEALAAKTGCAWDMWVFVLDKAKAHTWPHADIARFVSEKYKLSGWWAQSVTVGYERIRGLREKGQRRGGSYEANKSRTFNVPMEVLFAAFSQARRRARWLSEPGVTVRKATDNRSIRMTWSDGTSVEGWFTAKAPTKSTVQVQHTRLASKADAERLKAYWGERLDALGDILKA